MADLESDLESNLEIRNHSSRFIRVKGVTLSSAICCMETRALQHSHGRNVNFLNTVSLLHISPILSDPHCTKQNITRPSTHCNIDSTLLANTVAVSTNVGNVNKETNSSTKFNHTFSRFKRKSPSISLKQNYCISGMVGFWEGSSLQRVSEETTQLTVKSRRQSILGNYESAWKKWSGQCDSWKVDPLRCPVNYVLEYLSSLFHREKLLYRTISLHRLVIFVYHVYVDDKPIGQQPLVCSLLSGIFKLRPPQPKYLYVRYVQEVLNFIKTKLGETEARRKRT